MAMIRKILTSAVVALSLSGAASAATTLFQDDFNANTVGYNKTPAGWTLVSGSVDILGNDNVRREQDGNYKGNGTYIDLDGSTNQAGRIQTTQQFNAVAGATYELTFDYGKNWAKNRNTAETLYFGFGGWQDVIAISTDPIPALLTVTYTFKALTSGLTSLFFGALGGDNNGPIIDNVLLTTVGSTDVAPVPVPAAGLLLLGAMGALAGLRRRKAVAA